MTAYISMIFALLTDPSVLAAVCLIAAICGFRKALQTGHYRNTQKKSTNNPPDLSPPLRGFLRPRRALPPSPGPLSQGGGTVTL